MVWGRGGLVAELDVCSLCGMAGVGLQHILADCSSLCAHRRLLPVEAQQQLPSWALFGSEVMYELAPRVRYTGVCLCALVCGRQLGSWS